MQPEAAQHRNFGQPVVSEDPAHVDVGAEYEGLLTPAQAAARFNIPEYLLRKTCAEGDLDHVRVINALWLAPAAVAAFAESWRAQKRRR